VARLSASGGLWRRIVGTIDSWQRRHPLGGLPVAVLDRGSSLAALMAFYAFFSLFPLLLLAILGVTLVGATVATGVAAGGDLGPGVQEVAAMALSLMVNVLILL